MILLITIKHDTEHTGLVIKHLRNRRAKFFRLNTDALSTDYAITFGFDGHRFYGVIVNTRTGKRVDTRDVTAVWYRRVRVSPPTGDVKDKGMLDYARDEHMGFIRNLLSLLKHASWMNDERLVHLYQDHRLLQYQLAVQVGLTVPGTMYTNVGSDLIGLLRQRGSLALKPISNTRIKEGSGKPDKVHFTHRLVPDEFSDAQLAASCQHTPVQVQEYVEKDVEIRLTMVGERMFACEIASQASERTQVDWRHYDFDHVSHKTCTLPRELEEKIRAFMKLAGLVYGAIDLIRKPDGTYVFLEVNPAGQWNWIEILTGMPISKAIALWLIQAEQRE